MRVKKLYVKYFVIAFIFVAILIGVYIYQQSAESILTYNAFISAVEKGEVDEVYFYENQDYLQVKLVDQAKQHKVPKSGSEGFLEYLMSNNVQILYKDTASSGSPIGQILLILAAAGVFFYYRFKRPNNSLIIDVNQKSKDTDSLLLKDIAGNVEAKAMVSDVIQFIKNPEKYVRMGAKMPRGILFYGPPGTGKTLMAKAIAGEAGVPFYPMSGSDFIQLYVGVGASRIRELFAAAKKAEKAVIFIDEIDAIGKRRSKHPDSGNDERDQTLNALLAEMSGFSDRDGIIVIAATNRLDTLDEALTRPGRFDRLVEIGLPDVNARKKILELHAGSKNLSDAVNLTDLSKSTVSFSGAMLENLLNEAAIIAANDDKPFIEPSHIDKAFYMVIAGAEKSDTSFITTLDRKITAYHEAGHALITKLCLPDSYISRVTIIPSTKGAGGFSLSIPKDSLYMTKQKMLANMKILLAGRASEELIFGADEITTGAGSDIEKASGLVMDYINKYGMDESFGLFNSDILNTPPTSELMDLCRNKLNELYSETKNILTENLNVLHTIASALLEKETLNASDIDSLCA